jgi:hypothetical protein
VAEKDATVTVDTRPGPALNTVVAWTDGGPPGVGQGVATPPGGNVTVEPLPDVTITFENTGGGATTVTASNVSSVTLPGGYRANGIPVFFSVNTTARFTGAVTVCLPYDDTGLSALQEGALRVLHEEGVKFVDRTGSLDPQANQACAQVTGLSQFTVMSADAPALNDIVASPKRLRPTGRFERINLTPIVVDDDDPQPTCVVTAVLTEPGGAYRVRGPLLVELRAVRSLQRGRSRTYTVEVTCRDDALHTGSGRTTVTVSQR